MLSNSCNMAEASYGQPPPPEHIYFVALYTAFAFYADDHCGTDPGPIGQFSRRAAAGEPQLDSVLDRFAEHVKHACDLWPTIAANSIVTGTFDSINAMYLEYTIKDMKVIPGATRYPYYLRTRSGVGPPYAHMMFPVPEAVAGRGRFVHSNHPVSYIFIQQLFQLTTGPLGSLTNILT